jgi:hypothetical protein
VGRPAASANNPVSFSDPDGRMLLDDAGGSNWKPLSHPNASTVVDQNGVPHVLSSKPDNAASGKGLNFLNARRRGVRDW